MRGVFGCFSEDVTAAAIGPKWPAAAVLSLWVLVTPVLYGPSMLGSSTTDSGFELGTDIRSGATDVLLPPFCFTTQKPPCVTSHHSSPKKVDINIVEYRSIETTPVFL